MALAPDDPLLWGILFLLVFLVELVVVANIKRVGRGKADKYERPSEEAVLAEGEMLTDVLSRFVEDKDGERLGETVGMDGKLVIVKGRDPIRFHAVPRDALTLEGEAFKVTGDVDWPAAAAEGEAWREKQHRVVDYGAHELPEDERASV